MVFSGPAGRPLAAAATAAQHTMRPHRVHSPQVASIATSISPIDELRQDGAYALRQLRRAPGFAAVAVATLALGIGASTTMFSVVQAILLRPLPLADPDRLTQVRPSSGARVSTGYVHDWRAGSRAFRDLAAWRDVRANLTGRGEPREVLADRATTNFFDVLGVQPLVGRTFTTGTSLAGVQPEVVLSHGFWQQQFGGDPGAVGQPLTLDAELFTIVGVMPEGFVIRTNELVESRAEIWLPLPLVPDSRTGMGGFLNVVGRLAPGATREQAQAELMVISRRIEAEFPSYSRDWGVNVIALHDATVRDVRLRLVVLFGAVGILLLIACANVANLALGRALTRDGELAIRVSLGATRGRLIRQLTTESLVLAVIGGGLGVVLAAWGSVMLVSAIPASAGLPRARDIGVDAPVIAFALLVTLLTTVLFGLLPSIASTRRAPQSALQQVTRSGSSAPRHRLGGALVIAEVALALLLLAGAGLLGRSFWSLIHVNPGFRADEVLTLRTTLARARYDSNDRIRTFAGELLARAAALPGVRAVGFADYLPLSNIGAGGSFEVEGRPPLPPAERLGSWITVVGGDYFAAMGVPLLRGRVFTAADTADTTPVFVIDELLANREWPNADPIGARMTWRFSSGALTGEVIGVVGSVRYGAMAEDPVAATYFWFPQRPGRDLSIVVRTSGNPLDAAGPIAAEVRAIDPSQPVADIRLLHDFVSSDLSQSRFTLWVLAGFASAALLLAAIGLYGVIAFGVSRRRQEIGIRIALGAGRADVLRMVMVRGLLLTMAGLAIGAAAALALGRVMAGLLYGIAPSDPATLAAVTATLAAVAVAATLLPALRATRVDPVTALRSE
jgi:predicted permease